MRFRIKNIEWNTEVDTEEEYEGADEGEPVEDLPSVMAVEVDDEKVILFATDYDMISSLALDAASDETGWLINESTIVADPKTAPAGFDAQAYNRRR